MLEAVERILLARNLPHDGREPAEGENFADGLIDPEGPQSTPGCGQLLDGAEQDAEPGTADVVESRKIHSQFAAAPGDDRVQSLLRLWRRGAVEFPCDGDDPCVALC